MNFKFQKIYDISYDTKEHSEHQAQQENQVETNSSNYIVV